jgi:hypothetical protein
MCINALSGKQEAVMDKHHDMEGAMSPYRKHALMTTASTVIMFGLMYLNTYQLDHVLFS